MTKNVSVIYFKTETMRIIIILTLLVPTIANGQLRDKVDNKFSIKISPLSLIDIYSGSSYRAGLELRLSPGISFYGEGGGYFKNFNGLKNIKGYIIKSEIRYYYNNNSDNYFSIEYLYKRQNYFSHDSITIGTGYYKNYNVDKYVNCLTVKYGKVMYLNTHFYLDLFFGVGIRYKNVHVDLNDEEKKKRYYYNDSQSRFFTEGEGKKYLPNIDAGIKIGFIVK